MLNHAKFSRTLALLLATHSSKFFSVFFKAYVIAHTEYENYTYGNKSITKNKNLGTPNLKHRLSTIQHSSVLW